MKQSREKDQEIQDYHQYGKIASLLCKMIFDWYNNSNDDDDIPGDRENVFENDLKSFLLFQQRSKILRKVNYCRRTQRFRLQQTPLHQRFYIAISQRFGITTDQFEDLMDFKDEIGHGQDSKQTASTINVSQLISAQRNLSSLPDRFREYQDTLDRAVNILITEIEQHPTF